MSIAGKAFMLAVSVGVWASCPCGAEVLRADRIELEVPDGGMTLSRTPGSVSTFKHRSLDLTITAAVEGARYFDSWKKGCAPENVEADIAAAYQAGTLPRTDQHLYSRISKDSEYGISTPRGSWLQHCLIFRSNDLAAKVTIDLSKSALARGEIAAAEIEKILASARLTAASVEDRGASDPRIVLALPGVVVPAGLPTYTFQLDHNRLPLGIGVRLSDPKSYETAKLLNKVSAMAWRVGSLARSDEHFYYFLRPDRYPHFTLGFLAEGTTAQIDVTIDKASLDRGDIMVQDIERMLASARIVPASEAIKR
jgi:hypothetical protein